jgi:formylglycine-generating enzyme required for sulfatase activity
LRAEGFVAVDVAGYVAQGDGTPVELCCGIWGKRADDDEDTRFYVGASAAEHKSIYDEIKDAGYRLPTEAEWEYACQAETRTSRCYGRSDELLGKYAWYAATAQHRTWPVGSLKPNDFGLFDMYGNVLEWCQEKRSSYPVEIAGKSTEDVEDTAVVSSRESRVLRGLSFHDRPGSVRSAQRFGFFPGGMRNEHFGFRVARTCSQTAPAQTSQGD